LVHGHFGENFTIEGLPDDTVCVGDHYRSVAHCSRSLDLV
jgi:MOSC domain-containing protein YiiM